MVTGGDSQPLRKAGPPRHRHTGLHSRPTGGWRALLVSGARPCLELGRSDRRAVFKVPEQHGLSYTPLRVLQDEQARPASM